MDKQLRGPDNANPKESTVKKVLANSLAVAVLGGIIKGLMLLMDTAHKNLAETSMSKDLSTCSIEGIDPGIKGYVPTVIHVSIEKSVSHSNDDIIVQGFTRANAHVSISFNNEADEIAKVGDDGKYSHAFKNAELTAGTTYDITVTATDKKNSLCNEAITTLSVDADGKATVSRFTPEYTDTEGVAPIDLDSTEEVPDMIDDDTSNDSTKDSPI